MSTKLTIFLTIIALFVLFNCAVSAALTINLAELQDDIDLLYDGGILAFESLDLIHEAIDYINQDLDFLFEFLDDAINTYGDPRS